MRQNQEVVKDQNGEAEFHCCGNAKILDFETEHQNRKICLVMLRLTIELTGATDAARCGGGSDRKR